MKPDTDGQHKDGTDGGLIVIPLSDVVIYPGSRTKLQVDRAIGDTFRERLEAERPVRAIGLTLKEDAADGGVSGDSFYPTGCLFTIDRMQKSDGGYIICAEAVGRVRATGFAQRDGLLAATYETVPDIADLDAATGAQVLSEIHRTLHDIGDLFPNGAHFTEPLARVDSVDRILGFVMPFLPADLAAKQELLEIASVRERAFRFLEILARARDELAVRIEVGKKVAEKVNRSNREAVLREQLRAIREELGEGDGAQGDGDYRARIEGVSMPADIQERALAELKKLEHGGPHNHEAPVIRNYLDLLLGLPWKSEEIRAIDLAEARRVLDSHHAGLTKVKDRIVQHLAVMKLKQEKQGSILLFTGPPGTGKTSLGKSIAEALGREYVRISLGGVRDEAEIRGHRRTYVGALPGRIIQGMKKAGTKNPVFILDEVDKLAVSYAGDPASALLEVLDPEQNSAFSDHYLEVPYDLSDVLFIATANTVSTIPPPLLDRLEQIEIPGYTSAEKFTIARDHLLPAVLAEHGLSAAQLRITDEALVHIIGHYTREAGVRWLKKQLATIARYSSEKIVSAAAPAPCVVTPAMLSAILGREPFRLESARKEPVPGVATGLAWTPAGGEILFIECTFMPGTGKLTLTGQLGEVMKESATISMSLIRSRLATAAAGFNFLASDIHIHVPSGATPKDGPSAGITLFAALASLITGKTVDPATAMTGEITLSGAVLPVGGIREKVLAAHRSGIRRVVLPKENLADLADIPEDVKAELAFVPVETAEDALKATLGIGLPGIIIVPSGGIPAPAQKC